MARIKTAALVAQAGGYALRADYVRKDPAVIKAAKQAGKDLIQAGGSVSELAYETRAAWRRSGSAA